MPTFYKYAERNANSQLNWGDIGKSMSETLAESSRLREEKRAKIDADTNKLNETLVNAPRGEDANGNAFTLQYADDATKYMLMINKLLKSGNMDVRQYTTNMANITSNTNTAFKVQNEFQAQVKSLRERAESNDPANKSQQLEQDYNDFLKTFGDLSSSRLMINPTDGNVTVGKIDPNNPTKLLPQSMLIGDLWKGATMKFNYYDSQKSTSQIAAGIASQVVAAIGEGSISKIGTIKTVDDALANPEIETSIKSLVKAQTTNQFNATSILTNNIGGYTSVFLKSEYDKMSPEEKENVIFYDNSKGYPNPELTEGQMEVAEKYLFNQIKTKVRRDEKITTFESQESITQRANLQALSRQNAIDEKRRQWKEENKSSNIVEKWGLHLKQRVNYNDLVGTSKNITGKDFKNALNSIPGTAAYKAKEEYFASNLVGTPNKHRVTLTSPDDPSIKKVIEWSTVPSDKQLTEIRNFMTEVMPGAGETWISTLGSLDKAKLLPEIGSTYKGLDSRGNAIYK